MMNSNHDQLVLMLYCLGGGVWLNLVWETVGCLHILMHTPKRSRFCCDVLLSIISGLALFLLALAVNGGEWQPWMPVVTAVGCGISHPVCGRLLKRLTRWLKPHIDRLQRLFERCWQKSGE